jgi:hypothetical protein
VPIPPYLKALILSASPQNRPGEAEMVALVRYAAEQLSQAMGCDVSCDDWAEDARPGFIRTWIYSATPQLGILSITWRGILACYLRHEVPGIAIGATLFLYSNSLKLQTRDRRSFVDLYCLYDEEQSQLLWKTDGWRIDEYREYPEFDDDRELRLG